MSQNAKDLILHVVVEDEVLSYVNWRFYHNERTDRIQTRR